VRWMFDGQVRPPTAHFEIVGGSLSGMAPWCSKSRETWKPGHCRCRPPSRAGWRLASTPRPRALMAAMQMPHCRGPRTSEISRFCHTVKSEALPLAEALRENLGRGAAHLPGRPAGADRQPNQVRDN